MFLTALRSTELLDTIILCSQLYFCISVKHPDQGFYKIMWDDEEINSKTVIDYFYIRKKKSFLFLLNFKWVQSVNCLNSWNSPVVTRRIKWENWKGSFFRLRFLLKVCHFFIYALWCINLASIKPTTEEIFKRLHYWPI